MRNHLFLLIVTPLCIIIFLNNSKVYAQNIIINCSSEIFPKKIVPTDLKLKQFFNYLNNSGNFEEDNLPDFIGIVIILTQENVKRNELILNTNKPKKILYPNFELIKNKEIWKIFNSTETGWGNPFKDCDYFPENWFYIYVLRKMNQKIGFFIKMNLDRCDEKFNEFFDRNPPHKCLLETQMCVNGTNNNGKTYRCICKNGYFYPDFKLNWNGIDSAELEQENKFIINKKFLRCEPCPENCPKKCASNGICMVENNEYLRIFIITIQLISMGIVLGLTVAVFKQRKTKAIASGMWTILEIILLGIFILYCTVIIRILKPSIIRCLLERWIREMGFIIFYGAIILKLYRHLIEFRTRKAHRWILKDIDLLKYLLIMTIFGIAYLASFTALTLNFLAENCTILEEIDVTNLGEQFFECKFLWWDYVTELGELTILLFGIHLAYASRNAHTQFHERNFLCVTVSLELITSIIFYSARIFAFTQLHPDIILIIYCVKSQICQTVSLILIFLPKFWYQHKQIRSLGQEYSSRFPLDAFRSTPSQRTNSSANNSDVEIGEISIAEMNPDDIRAELKRLYFQLETFKAKTICQDNPHISKRRGGRKPQHRRFSLQKKVSKEKMRRTMSLHTKQRSNRKENNDPSEIAETDHLSRTPEDSICSTENASGIYTDLQN